MTNINIKEASVRVTKILCRGGYISIKRMQDLVFRLEAGDRTAYTDVREIMLKMADEIGRIK